MLTQELPKAEVDWERAYNEMTNQKAAADEVIVRAIALGSRIMSIEFQRAAAEALANNLIDRFQTPGYEAIIYAFDNLPAGDPTLQFLVDVHCAFWMEEHDDENNR
ncbi:hypothetical protein CC80DRAFT_474246, partial [Byssothecium circinans]